LSNLKLPELLSPCGNYDSLKAAVFAGADAVYLGGTAFNARINADNFDNESLKKAVDFCHGRGVKLYVTLNTLVYDRRLNEALSFAHYLYGIGVDALIVADGGLSVLLKKYLPDFELHASTQFSSHNSLSSAYLKKLGFKRFVCARELSLRDLKRLCEKSELEVEMFCHGALCASHSGQCLMSSFIGGRSGNRGECAQPCRMSYNGSFPLSLKDLCLASHIKEILSLGVASLKIEGRMKSPSYVYAVTDVYRRLLDEGRNATPKEISSLAAVFSRGGFTDGYFTSDHSNMIGVRSEKDKSKTLQSNVKITDKRLTRPRVIVKRADVAPPASVKPEKPKKTNKINTARFLSADKVYNDGYFDIVYLPLFKFDPSKANGVVMPAVVLDTESSSVRAALEDAYKKGARHVLCGNTGHIALCRDIGYTLHGDYRLNVVNSFSPFKEDFEDIILSPELNLAQIRDVDAPKSVILYGKIPVMLLERRVGAAHLRDRRGASFPVVKEGKRDILINNVPVYMADKLKDVEAAGIQNRHFIFTDESEQEVSAIIEKYKKGLPDSGDFRRIK